MSDIKAKIDELIALIGKQDEITRYNELVKIMENNELIQAKISEFKKYQQKMVIYESKGNKVPEEAQKRYDELYDELLEIPLYNEYLALLNEINTLYQDIIHIIETEVNKDINREVFGMDES